MGGAAGVEFGAGGIAFGAAGVAFGAAGVASAARLGRTIASVPTDTASREGEVEGRSTLKRRAGYGAAIHMQRGTLP